MNELLVPRMYVDQDFAGQTFVMFPGDDAVFLRCDFSNANLEGAQFNTATFLKCKFYRTDLALASAFGLRAFDCQLEECVFREASLESAAFVCCEVVNCDFGPAELGASGYFKNLHFLECEIHGAIPRGATVQACGGQPRKPGA